MRYKAMGVCFEIVLRRSLTTLQLNVMHLEWNEAWLRKIEDAGIHNL
jgi:hypothetical protein